MKTDLLGVYGMQAFSFIFTLLGPIFLGLVVVSLVAGYGQVGFKITPKAIMPKFSKMNPISGIKNIFFSTRSLVELTKSIVKLVLISTFAYWVISDTILHSVELVRYSIEEIIGFMVATAFSFVWKLSILYGVLAAGDFYWQKHKHNKGLMMTKQEVKEESRMMDGDPQIKGKIRGKMLMMSRARMLKEVPKADVVITNPTHFAIALKYEAGNKSAPIVVAKGMDFMAQRIKKIATENNVPLHEDVQLARALYKVCEVGDQIPGTFYKAIAQILAFIFQAKYSNKKRSIV